MEHAVYYTGESRPHSCNASRPPAYPMQLHLHRSRASGYSLMLFLALATPMRVGSQIVSDSTRSGGVQSVRLISSYQLERERLGELAGDSLAAPMLLRSVSAYITRIEP